MQATRHHGTKVQIDVNQLKELYKLSVNNGTQEFFIPLIFEWAEAASEKALKYQKALEKIAEFNSSDNPCYDLVQLARKTLSDD